MSETIEVREGEDFDLAAVERHMRENIEGLPDGDLEVRQFPSGASNLTYLVKVGDWEGVLRRPPLGPLPPKAHDMGRESKILMKLHEAFPLAPKPYFFCEDESIVGAPFYLMERREGVIIDATFPQGVEPTDELRRGVSRTLVDTFVELHAVDWQKAGLGEFGRPEGFLERQVPRWLAQLDRYRVRELPELDFVTDWLERNRPEMSPPAIIHGDYSPFNVMVAPDLPPRLAAVIDWDTGTIGDPLLDIGHLLARWVEPGEVGPLDNTNELVGYPTRKEMAARYEQGSGRDLSALPYYEALSLFKLGVILEGNYARAFKAGVPDSENRMTNSPRRLFEVAAEFARGQRV
jgi:aminoglycoside phosphotransferase (APT) family kinase protein